MDRGGGLKEDEGERRRLASCLPDYGKVFSCQYDPERGEVVQVDDLHVLCLA